MQQLVIGLGTGRCGTRSLTKLFNQNGIKATHEKFKLFWTPKDVQVERLFKHIEPDVGFYWINYIDIVLERLPDTKFVCLKRPRKDVVASFMKSFESPFGRHLGWITHVEKEDLTCYRDTITQADFDIMDESQREWVEMYWDEYYPIRANLVGEYFPPHNLDNPKKALEDYWDNYYVAAEAHQKKHPDNFMLIGMHEALNTDDGRNQVLNFIGVCPNTQSQ